ncbi:hypothetical protein HMPREF0083_01200 [Aneurinibacillus aneurinilyticus ATCC 12856]|uniref:Uncharacterized protein n=2 Tax=Aneurinibacillus aneurinilyticus TaxID=1391 RepID=U1YIT8_ANEAE|nr:hypothetical protein HMPREF0083_01200 [Aneurinibacillus aneurinilyticus ATCC 12856]
MYIQFWLVNQLKTKGGAHMMQMVLLWIERLALALIVGGGIIMAAGIRPLLIPLLGERGNPALVSIIEKLSISAWNRYNRYAFLSIVLVVIIDILRIVTELPFSYWHAAIAIVIMIALLGKLAIDRELRLRLQEKSAEVVGSIEQNTGHRRVELLTKIILILAIILTI